MRKRFLVSFMLLCLLAMYGVCYAYTPASTDTGSLGNNQWRVQTDGDVVPVADSSYDLGETGSEISVIYADSLVVGGATYTSFAAGTDGNWTDKGTTTTLDQAPTAVIITHSTGAIAATQFNVGTGDVFLENDQKIDGGTNNAIAFGDNSDTFTATFTGNDISLDTSDGGFIFALTDVTDGTLDIRANNDADDYISFTTAANVPTIVTAGTSNLAIIPDGGTTAITGILTVSGATTSTGILTATAGLTLANGATLTEAVDGTTVFGGEATPIVSILATGTSDNDGTLQISSDNGEDNGDVWQVQADGATQDLLIRNNASGSQATKLTIADTTGLVTLTGGLTMAAGTNLTLPDSEVISNASDVVIVTADDAAASLELLGFEAMASNLKLYADQDGDASDGWTLTATTGGTFTVGNDSSAAGTDVVKLTIASTGLVTTTGDVTIAGTTPLLTIGDGGAEDAGLVIDGSTTDFYLSVDDTDGDLDIGTGSTAGTNSVISITDTTGLITTVGDIVVTGLTPTITIGDAGAEDNMIVFDGDTTDFYIGIDDTNHDLYIGTGSTAGTNPLIEFGDTDGAIMLTNAVTASSTVGFSGAITASSTAALNGDTTLGDASTDTITCTGRFIPRQAASTSSLAGTTGEVVYCTGDSKLYVATTGSATASGWSALN